MLNLVLFGPPGAGKGTQSEKLITKYGLVHLSTGDILRNEIARGTILGMEAKQLMDKGDLVGDDIVIGMIEAKLDATPDANGFIFDGFPRTQNQAIALDDLLQKKGSQISAMLALDVDNEELVKRLLLRGKASGRADDANEDIIRNRVNEYNNKTLPLKKYYSESAKFHSINGIGTIETIFDEICDRIIFVKAEIELTMLENDIEHLDLTINDFEVATEISPELKKDIDEVRNAEEKLKAKKAKAIVLKKTVKPLPIVKKAAAKKIVSKKTQPKKAIKKIAVKKVTSKKSTKKSTKKIAVKKTALKKIVVKKVVNKKPLPKKAIKKNAVKKQQPKKVIKKIAIKKIVKKKATKNAKPTKKIVAKKIIKKKK